MNNPHPKPACKILVVDDNRIIRNLLRLTFKDSTRYEVLEAESGEQALPLTIREKPTVIILDVMMPGELNGFEICRMIKSWPDTQHCNVIMLSARSQEQDFESGQTAGADFYVTKPFSPNELIALVESIHSDCQS